MCGCWLKQRYGAEHECVEKFYPSGPLIPSSLCLISRWSSLNGAYPPLSSSCSDPLNPREKLALVYEEYLSFSPRNSHSLLSIRIELPEMRCALGEAGPSSSSPQILLALCGQCSPHPLFMGSCWLTETFTQQAEGVLHAPNLL